MTLFLLFVLLISLMTLFLTFLTFLLFLLFLLYVRSVYISTFGEKPPPARGQKNWNEIGIDLNQTPQDLIPES